MDNVSRLGNLKELIGLLSLSFQVQKEVSSILEDYEIRLYSLEEDRKRCLNSIRKLETDLSTLRTQYSEALYKLSCK